MARTAVTHLSESLENGQAIQFDDLRRGLFYVHIAIIAYVGTGWMIPSRAALYVYSLLLPLIALQWLLNGGSSIVNNIENLLRVGQWNDPNNQFEGKLFKSLLQAAGIPATQAQITTVCCSLMLIFWVCAICHMMLIVPAT